MQKNEIIPLSYITLKNELKVLNEGGCEKCGITNRVKQKLSERQKSIALV